MEGWGGVSRYVSLIGVAALIGLALAVPALSSIDAALVAPGIDPDSTLGWVLRVIAVLTTPIIVYACWVLVAIFLWRRGLRVIATTILVATAAGALGHLIIRAVVSRQRPPSLFEDTLTYENYAFPSGHMTAIALTGALVVFLVRYLGLRRRWAALAGTAVLIVALDRWAINAHWMSDLLGGILLGVTATVTAVALIRPTRLGATPCGFSLDNRRVALVYHPKRLQRWIAERLVPGAMVLPTRADATGDAQARAAVEAGADLILVAGGDGTLRQVASVLVGTSIQVGVLPAGTGNVLAFNLKIPRDIVAATQVALGESTREIDVLTVTFDSRSEICLVMSGAGVDAMALSDSPDALKRVLGTGAYAVGGLRQLGCQPFALGDNQPYEVNDNQAFMILIGNVSSLGPGLQIFPDGRPDDRQLDVLVASPRDPGEVVGSVLRVLTNKPHHHSIAIGQTDFYEVRFDRPVPCEVDGDVVGEASVMTARPGGTLLVMAEGSAA